MKWNEMNKGTYTTKKKKSYWEIWNLKLEKRHCRTGIGRSYEQGGRQNVDVKM